MAIVLLCEVTLYCPWEQEPLKALSAGSPQIRDTAD